MPLTFPAHQAPVLPLKLWRPEWFDGTALCVAAAAPDPASALIGAVSHVVIDGLTHTGRCGANRAHLNTVIGTVPLRGEFTIARLLQYVGHIGGSLVALAMFATIGRRRLFEAWYGRAALESVRDVQPATRQRVAFWLAAALLAALTFVVCLRFGRSPVFGGILAVVVGLLLAGSLPLTQS